MSKNSSLCVELRCVKELLRSRSGTLSPVNELRALKVPDAVDEAAMLAKR